MLGQETALARSWLARALDLPEQCLAMPIALPNGSTNCSYIGEYQNTRYMIRLSRKERAYDLDRLSEYNAYQSVGPLDISDEVLLFDVESGTKVAAFIESAREADPRDEEDAALAMAVLKKVHSVRSPNVRRGDAFADILMYESCWRRQSSHPDHDETQKKVMGLRPWLMDPAAERVLCHGDAIAENFLIVDRNGKKAARLVDWEFCAVDDPMLDIGIYAMYGNYDRAQTDRLIESYDPAMPPWQRRRVYGWIAVYAMSWSNWGEYELQAGNELSPKVIGKYDAIGYWLNILEGESKHEGT